MTSHSHHHAKNDAQDLGKLGYAQELFRTMGGFSNFAISFSIISILTGAVTLYGHGLKMGGPAQMSLGWPLVTLFTLAVVCSMAELASALPTSGAMYHWSCKLGGKGWGWFTAWFNIIGQIAAIAGIDYGCATFVTPLLGLQATTNNLLVVYAAILLSHALINHFGIRLVARLNDFSVTVHIIGVIVIVGALFLFAPKQPISFFFARVTSNGEGWSYGWAFVIGLLQAMWTYTGYDASASVSEETIDPRRRAPWGMVMAVVVSSVVGYLLLIALTLSIKDIPSVLGNPPEVVAILVGALGARAGSAFSALAAMAMWFCGLSAVTWSSRVIYAFARDEGMPVSRVWRHVGAKHLTPAPAIWLCTIAAFLAAVYSGAYAVVTAISTIGLYISYILPVWLHWRSGSQLERGPWHLGAYSRALNVIAILWVIFLCVVLCLADARTWKAILAVTIALAVWYGLRERTRFHGPEWANH
ncbi:MAG TPA: amino acid permease [Blastocatellia bacterium]|nr:amino acid permease [Blastocatellia bacterium]HMV81756.1 amino acid permease [Blastocatellia bacterium]HMX26260.1 amino acid permease [Blastocatellia bacterium]HMY71236.1 amino acid permease [Blastocatellia bacterium]HMZ18191.1 amino acid permease [Blastocatellia bacterium]